MDPFVGEIRIFAGNFAPRGWAFCEGQLMAISQNTALFSLLGTTYGGNGQTTFALPDLRGRAPMQWGQGPGLTDRVLGETAGSPFVTLLTTEMPNHSHGNLRANPAVADADEPAANRTLGRSVGGPIYSSVLGTPVTMNPLTIGVAGSGQPHNNLQPYLALSFIIALQGIFPPRS